ncbi:MAG: transcriptional regulator, partial [Bacteroidota bacterium]
SNLLPELFPQHGEGKKHDRDIILEKWQEHIVDAYPLEFFRGLYHSDGSRSQNIVKGKNYPRYMFSNYSADIRKLFTDTAEKLGLTWTTANARNVAISRREDVAWLDEHIGEKS